MNYLKYLINSCNECEKLPSRRRMSLSIDIDENNASRSLVPVQNQFNDVSIPRLNEIPSVQSSLHPSNHSEVNPSNQSGEIHSVNYSTPSSPIHEEHQDPNVNDNVVYETMNLNKEHQDDKQSIPSKEQPKLRKTLYQIVEEYKAENDGFIQDLDELKKRIEEFESNHILVW